MDEDADVDGPHNGWFETQSEDDTYSHVYEFEKALDSLLDCSLRRRKWDGQVRFTEAPEDVG